MGNAAYFASIIFVVSVTLIWAVQRRRVSRSWRYVPLDYLYWFFLGYWAILLCIYTSNFFFPAGVLRLALDNLGSDMFSGLSFISLFAYLFGSAIEAVVSRQRRQE